MNNDIQPEKVCAFKNKRGLYLRAILIDEDSPEKGHVLCWDGEGIHEASIFPLDLPFDKSFIDEWYSLSDNRIMSIGNKRALEEDGVVRVCAKKNVSVSYDIIYVQDVNKSKSV